MSAPRNPIYDGVDWSRPTAELAAALGKTPQAINAARRARGLATQRGGKRDGAGRKKAKGAEGE